MRWKENVARMSGEKRTQFWWESLEENDYLADLRVDVRIISKYIFNKQDRMAWNEFIRFTTRAVPEFRTSRSPGLWRKSCQIVYSRGVQTATAFAIMYTLVQQLQYNSGR